MKGKKEVKDKEDKEKEKEELEIDQRLRDRQNRIHYLTEFCQNFVRSE